MSQPPEITEHLTDTQRLAHDITTALNNLTHNWPHMIRNGETQAPGIASRSGVLLDDHDPRDADQNRITKIISLRRLAQDQLADWCRLIIEDRGTTHGTPARTDVPAMTAFLTRHADWLSGHETAPDARDELRTLARACHHIVNPPVREHINLGACPLEVEFNPDNGPETCNGKVVARPNAEDRDGEVMAECRRCGTEAVTAWWESQMFRDDELKVLLTAEQVVPFVHKSFGKVITRSVVRGWDKRGIIEPAGHDEAGRRLYHRDALVWALARRERREAL